MIFEKTVTFKEMDIDRYGRTVGMVTIGEINVNESLLSAGLAWHYTKYDSNSHWSELEAVAKKERKGLWVMPNAVAPWEWRKAKK